MAAGLHDLRARRPLSDRCGAQGGDRTPPPGVPSVLSAFAAAPAGIGAVLLGTGALPALPEGEGTPSTTSSTTRSPVAVRTTTAALARTSSSRRPGSTSSPVRTLRPGARSSESRAKPCPTFDRGPASWVATTPSRRRRARRSSVTAGAGEGKLAVVGDESMFAPDGRGVPGGDVGVCEGGA